MMKDQISKDNKPLFISGKESIKIYENQFLESITTTHHIVPFVIFIPVILYFLYETIFFSYTGQYQLWYNLPLIFGGFILWTFIEYTGHRYVFHSNPKSELGKRLLYLIHGAHHDYPNDPRRLVVPPLVSIPGGILLYWISFELLGRYMASPFFFSLVLAYLIYDWFHYASHHMTFKNKYFRMLVKHHLMHHYRDPENGFGFTTTVWDKILNTMFKK